VLSVHLKHVPPSGGGGDTQKNPKPVSIFNHHFVTFFWLKLLNSALGACPFPIRDARGFIPESEEGLSGAVRVGGSSWVTELFRERELGISGKILSTITTLPLYPPIHPVNHNPVPCSLVFVMAFFLGPGFADLNPVRVGILLAHGLATFTLQCFVPSCPYYLPPLSAPSPRRVAPVVPASPPRAVLFRAVTRFLPLIFPVPLPHPHSLSFIPEPWRRRQRAAS
jgi:hypothetical protein